MPWNSICHAVSHASCISGIPLWFCSCSTFLEIHDQQQCTNWNNLGLPVNLDLVVVVLLYHLTESIKLLEVNHRTHGMMRLLCKIWYLFVFILIILIIPIMTDYRSFWLFIKFEKLHKPRIGFINYYYYYYYFFTITNQFHFAFTTV